MAAENPVSILICGAGAAGLTLAIELARRDISFRIVEKLAQPFSGSRGKGIQPRTQEIFEDLGIIDRIVAIGGLYPPHRTYRSDGSHADSEDPERRKPTPAEPYQIPLMVPQFLTEQILRDRLAELGHAVEYGCELTGFTQDEGGISAEIVSGGDRRSVRADYLVGADGGRSFVRHELGIGFPGKTLGVRAIVADVALEGLERDAWHQFNQGDMQRMVAIVALGGTDLFQLQAPIPLEGEVDLTAGGLQQMVAERTGRSDIRINSVSWASAYLMNARLADSYRVGRVFLAGDAAHTHPPTGGQGLNTSVQDAYNLGWKLAAVVNGAPAALLDSYEQERRPVAAGMLGLASELLEEMKQGLMRRGRTVHQLDIGYHGSALAFDPSQRDGILFAGDRAPDAPLRGAGGQSRRLFEMFAGAHWTLVGYETSGAIGPYRQGLRIVEVGPGRELIDEHGHLRAAYGLASGEWVLVRPDGYIACIIMSDRAAELEGFLARAGLPTILE
ncbi:FAD-dependent oxidoreductase [Sphingobium sp.]|uniref:FAD-dependent oxidoreductase n=1 Tax=Sphingobium sp. TaxID=1912891 RepID=UPI000DAFBCB4|nr:FAD-dependent oxidoreductase [Sphingobium sp.]PZU69330.1 MAG: 2-polyprenyl-6-methoxyphenol hydroxylase [Sphingobium sp.]